MSRPLLDRAHYLTSIACCCYECRHTVTTRTPPPQLNAAPPFTSVFSCPIRPTLDSIQLLHSLLDVVPNRSARVAVPVNDKGDNDQAENDKVGCRLSARRTHNDRNTNELTEHEMRARTDELGYALEQVPGKVKEAMEEREDDVERRLDDGEDRLEQALKLQLVSVSATSLRGRDLPRTCGRCLQIGWPLWL